MGLFDRLLGRQRRPSFEDHTLGVLEFDPEDECWVGAFDVAGQRITVRIAGTDRPDARLLAHARDLARGYESFAVLVEDFLAAESGREKWEPEEVKTLRLDEICLFWPERPEDGMLYFYTDRSKRVWRCDYIGRTPRDLGFDG